MLTRLRAFQRAMLYPSQLFGRFEALATVSSLGEAGVEEVWMILGTMGLAGVARGQLQSLKPESLTVPCCLLFT